jgi:hypothetical protein
LAKLSASLVPSDIIAPAMVKIDYSALLACLATRQVWPLALVAREVNSVLLKDLPIVLSAKAAIKANTRHLALPFQHVKIAIQENIKHLLAPIRAIYVRQASTCPLPPLAAL